ncbi:MAG: protein kinase [Candidatus Riflebacteria bacterium]|nr:protein kinase [Candidatus Riflebacteria bacterium]
MTDGHRQRGAPEFSPAFLKKYTILAPLGAGSMGTVYLATQHPLRREVAVKILTEFTDEGRARFEREYRIMASFSHPAIVRLYDFGQDGDLHYLVCEYVNGGTVRSLMDRGPVSLSQALRLSADLADALAYAHEHGVIHRDVKPANVFLTATAQVKLADFGLARPVARGGTLTQSSMGVGSPLYMAPELVVGERATAQADQYSLGVMMYQLIAGRSPFAGADHVRLLFAKVESTAPALADMCPGVPAQVDEIVNRALARDPEARFPSMAELALRLGVAAGSLQPAARRERPPAENRTDPASCSGQPATKASGPSASGPRATSRTRSHSRLVGICLAVAAMVVASRLLWPPAGPKTQSGGRSPRSGSPSASDRPGDLSARLAAQSQKLDQDCLAFQRDKRARMKRVYTDRVLQVHMSSSAPFDVAQLNRLLMMLSQLIRAADAAEGGPLWLEIEAAGGSVLREAFACQFALDGKQKATLRKHLDGIAEAAAYKGLNPYRLCLAKALLATIRTGEVGSYQRRRDQARELIAASRLLDAVPWTAQVVARRVVMLSRAAKLWDSAQDTAGFLEKKVEPREDLARAARERVVELARPLLSVEDPVAKGQAWKMAVLSVFHDCARLLIASGADRSAREAALSDLMVLSWFKLRQERIDPLEVETIVADLDELLKIEKEMGTRLGRIDLEAERRRLATMPAGGGGAGPR